MHYTAPSAQTATSIRVASTDNQALDAIRNALAKHLSNRLFEATPGYWHLDRQSHGVAFVEPAAHCLTVALSKRWFGSFDHTQEEHPLPVSQDGGLIDFIVNVLHDWHDAHKTIGSIMCPNPERQTLIGLHDLWTHTDQVILHLGQLLGIRAGEIDPSGAVATQIRASLEFPESSHDGSRGLSIRMHEHEFAVANVLSAQIMARLLRQASHGEQGYGRAYGLGRNLAADIIRDQTTRLTHAGVFEDALDEGLTSIGVEQFLRAPFELGLNGWRMAASTVDDQFSKTIARITQSRQSREWFLSHIAGLLRTLHSLMRTTFLAQTRANFVDKKAAAKNAQQVKTEHHKTVDAQSQAYEKAKTEITRAEHRNRELHDRLQTLQGEQSRLMSQLLATQDQARAAHERAAALGQKSIRIEQSIEHHLSLSPQTWMIGSIQYAGASDIQDLKHQHQRWVVQGLRHQARQIDEINVEVVLDSEVGSPDQGSRDGCAGMIIKRTDGDESSPFIRWPAGLLETDHLAIDPSSARNPKAMSMASALAQLSSTDWSLVQHLPTILAQAVERDWVSSSTDLVHQDTHRTIQALKGLKAWLKTVPTILRFDRFEVLSQKTHANQALVSFRAHQVTFGQRHHRQLDFSIQVGLRHTSDSSDPRKEGAAEQLTQIGAPFNLILTAKSADGRRPLDGWTPNLITNSGEQMVVVRLTDKGPSASGWSGLTDLDRAFITGLIDVLPLMMANGSQMKQCPGGIRQWTILAAKARQWAQLPPVSPPSAPPLPALPAPSPISAQEVDGKKDKTPATGKKAKKQPARQSVPQSHQVLGSISGTSPTKQAPKATPKTPPMAPSLLAPGNDNKTQSTDHAEKPSGPSKQISKDQTATRLADFRPASKSTPLSKKPAAEKTVKARAR